MTELTFVDTWSDVEALLSWLGESRRPFLAVDVETSGLSAWSDELRLVQFGDTERGWALDFRDWKGVVREVIDRWDGELVAHNFKFDGNFLEANGVPVPWDRLHCTMAMAHLIEPDKPKSLDSLSGRFLGDPKKGEAAIMQADMSRCGWTWGSIPTSWASYWVYATLDTVRTARLADMLWPQIRSAFRGIYDIEQASTHVVAGMERRGARIDVRYCARTLEAWRERCVQLDAWCREACNIENPLSDVQVIRYLEGQGVPLHVRTPTGRASINKDVLQYIDHPLAQVILELRQLTKFGSTYLENFIASRDANDRVHAKVHPQGARTGRMSVTDPALQTLPRGPEVRDAFIPDEENVLLLCDLDQVEMRLLAHFAHEDSMMAMIHAGEDLHTAMACRLYNLTPETLSKPKRSIMKNANFAKVYGAGKRKFAITAGVSEAEGSAFLDAYDATFPGVRKFQRDLANSLESTGCVYTPYGRRHPLDEGHEYKAVNYLVQGTAADYFKRALIELDVRGLSKYAVLPVHDEVVFDVPLKEVDEFAREAADAMGDATSFLVPITAGADLVARWGDKYRDDVPYYPPGASVSFDPLPGVVLTAEEIAMHEFIESEERAGR